MQSSKKKIVKNKLRSLKSDYKMKGPKLKFKYKVYRFMWQIERKINNNF